MNMYMVNVLIICIFEDGEENIIRFLKKHYNIKVTNQEEFIIRLFDFFSKAHEDKIMEPNNRYEVVDN